MFTIINNSKKILLSLLLVSACSMYANSVKPNPLPDYAGRFYWNPATQVDSNGYQLEFYSDGVCGVQIGNTALVPIVPLRFAANQVIPFDSMAICDLARSSSIGNCSSVSSYNLVTTGGIPRVPQSSSPKCFIVDCSSNYQCVNTESPKQMPDFDLSK